MLIVTQKCIRAPTVARLPHAFHSIHNISAWVFGSRPERVGSIRDNVAFPAHLGQQPPRAGCQSGVEAAVAGQILSMPSRGNIFAPRGNLEANRTDLRCP